MTQELKQVIVMRKDLNMRKGKMVAQGAHASCMAVLGQQVAKSESLKNWLATGMKKVCVSVDSEEELNKIIHQAREKFLPCFVVTDAGHTEFHGVPTRTCCAIGPADSDIIDQITGNLKLL
jgi:peptidyl-tRNA hydrolase, PTH2 family